METKYCSYNILPSKGKRKNPRRSCRKTLNSSENSDLCEVLNKRCGLKENHTRRLIRNSKRVSPSKVSVASKKLSVDTKNTIAAQLKKNLDTEELQTVLWMLEQIKFNPNYKSDFTGQLYKGSNAEYAQAMDKINGYFKFRSFYPDGNDTSVPVL
jgi:hypothetical protein